jgi:hypothetical protein
MSFIKFYDIFQFNAIYLNVNPDLLHVVAAAPDDVITVSDFVIAVVRGEMHRDYPTVSC